MKLLYCNGRKLEIREVGRVIFHLEAGSIPLWPAGGYKIIEDDKARAILRNLLSTRNYIRISADEQR